MTSTVGASSSPGPSTGSGNAREEFRLAYEPDGTSWTARENLTEVLARELLGPLNGAEESLTTKPDSVYLVGRIAPARLVGTGDPQSAESDDAPFDAGDGIDARDLRGVPVGADEENGPDGEEDNAEDLPQKRGLMIPASMGLRFQVPLDLREVTVNVTWGVYRSGRAEQTTRAGRPITEYRRTPVEHAVIMDLGSLQPGRTKEYQLDETVVLRVDSYADDTLDRRLVEVALCNDRETPRRIPIDAWLFQTRLRVESEGAEVFLPVNDLLTDTRTEADDELRLLNLQYRNRLEFAIGRTCSADWTVGDGSRRASRVETSWLPVVETPQTRAVEVPEAVLDMRKLQSADAEEVRAGLHPILAAYRSWLDDQDAEVATLPAHLHADAEWALHRARQVLGQLEVGLDHLTQDPEALRCFQFMNRVMGDQRMQTQIAEQRSKNPHLDVAEAEASILKEHGVRAHSWRTFQLAFILMQLEGLTTPDLPRRSSDLTSRVELLFFPTGGGKTEAYLGLAAFAFAVRRRQGVIRTPGGGLDGRAGVTVLMRYTLRLLTSQQFQRATAMVCAAELARREDPEIWGAEPFRIGLWVGTDVSPKRFDEAKEQIQKVNQGESHRLTVLQVQRCPWCGTKINPSDVKAVDGDRRIHVYCGDELGDCPFSDGGLVPEGLPVLTVDEEIYRLVPAFVIATVDKFARLAREGEAAALFGYVRRRCDRHGFVHDDYQPCSIQDGNKHPARRGQPAASIRPVPRLRPPDLIIQDELHLITGALGTTVGLFELAIDALTTWQTQDGNPVRPMIIASTATVRNAQDQVKGLYGRGVTMFPPQVLDVADTFFSKELPISRENPGRRYLGVSTTGVRMTSAEIRLATIALAAGQLLIDRDGASADPYLTLVGYFNAIRELAGMTRFLSDDVQIALEGGRPWSALPRRYGKGYGDGLRVAELTSRVSSADIGRTLDEMAIEFDPELDATGAWQQSGQRKKDRPANPYDAVLATSMLQVGVDVSRLGLMVMVGQPKNTAEYIQASSRVGRDAKRPGLVITLGNWARPRDLAHFEQFRHYHETFYAQVEALSVTPFSITSIERGIAGVLVSAARVLDAEQSAGLSPEAGAMRILDRQSAVEQLIDRIALRAEVASDEAGATIVRQQLKNRLDLWVKRRQYVVQRSRNLVYERVTKPTDQAALLISAENIQTFSTAGEAEPLVAANSMREVQPEIILLVSPLVEKLYLPEPPGSPAWKLPSTDQDTTEGGAS